MSTGALITLIAAIVVIAAIVLYVAARRSGGDHGNLRRRFGPEYELAVHRHGGDTRAAEDELRGRLRRHGDLRPLPLAPEDRRAFSGEWDALQERFVDDPTGAVAGAEQLIDRLARERGYPAEGYEARAEALSVHHAEHVAGYRKVHDLSARLRGEAPQGPGHAGVREPGARTGTADTEELRETFVAARVLFDALLTATGDHTTHPHHRRGLRKQARESDGALRHGTAPGSAVREARTPAPRPDAHRHTRGLQGGAR
ncbi:hypothetical protein ACFV3R_15150 [Streptomyces sp. NPDC059740]|uniref:hypothetical protein n=1 Tax=Streptomyces sp. NPDC059740 TaxID=3346926 RepID=UPI003666B0E3